MSSVVILVSPVVDLGSSSIPDHTKSLLAARLSRKVYVWLMSFLPRCILCRAVLAMAEMSVRLSVKRVDKTKETSADSFIPYEISIILVFRKKNGWWGRSLVPAILGQTDPVRAIKPICNRYSVVYSALAVTPSEKCSTTNRKSRLFSEPKMNSVRCP